MNNKSIELRIKEAFDSAAPDVKGSVISELERERGMEENKVKMPERKKRTSRALKAAGFAAAAILLVLAGLAAIKLAGAPVKEESAYTLPPQRACTQNVSAGTKRLGIPTLVNDYEKADAVCEITVESWLSEDQMNTYHKAKVDKVYKGELPDTITFRQFGCASCPSDFPIFTHGNRLLVFLVEREDLGLEYPDYDRIYELTAHDLSALYIAEAEDGTDYLIDYDVLFSYNTNQKCPEVSLNNVSTPELMAKLVKSIRHSDELLADKLSDGSSPHSDLGEIKVYSLQDFTGLFAGLENE